MAELPETRNVELLVSDVNVNVLGPCCSCRKKEGVLKCSGCKAVTYCGEECQEKGWNHHKDVCNEIKQLLQQVNAAIEALAYEYGGVEALLKAPLVKDGLFRFCDKFSSSEDLGNFLFDNNYYPTKTEKYDIARWKLINAYAKCGMEASSKLAFRLAAENLLYMLRLCRNGKNQENQSPRMRDFTWHKYCGWMVAGDMDQQALNFLGFIISKGDHGRHPIMSVTLDVDLSVQEDIEGLSVFNRVKEEDRSSMTWLMFVSFSPRFKVHDLMLISLIKLKRIKALSVLRKEEEERWNTFLEGTQPRSGEFSVVLMLSGMAPVLEKIEGFVVDKTIDERIYLLSNQVNGLLMEVNERKTKLIQTHRLMVINEGNPKIIRGILDRQVEMVDNPTWPETDDEEKEEKENLSHYGHTDDLIPRDEKEVHIARYAISKYGHAWHMDKDCTTALRLFLETGNVMEVEEDNSPQTVAVEEDNSPQILTIEKDTSPETEMPEGDKSSEREMPEEDTSSGNGMVEKYTSPETEIVEVDASRETEMWQKDVSPETGRVKDKSHSNANTVEEIVKEIEDEDTRDDKDKTGESS